MDNRTKLTGKPNVMKEVNKGLIKDTLLNVETATRVEIAEATKISQPTVNAIMKEMLKEGLIVEVGHAISSGGRKAMRYALNQNAANVAAVILKPQELTYEIADIFGRSIEKGNVPVNRKKNYVQNLTVIVEKLLEQYSSIKALAGGVPGAVSEQGEIFAVPQIRELEKLNLNKLLKERYNIHVLILNDISTIAFGYYRMSIRKRQDDMVFVHIGEGLGASTIVGGKVLNGFSSFAGEIGYMKVNEESNIEAVLFSQDEKEKKQNVISRVIVNTICLINPPQIVFGGNDVSSELINGIRTYCLKELPAGMIPDFIILEDEDKFYLQGAVQSAIDSVREGISLVEH